MYRIKLTSPRGNHTYLKEQSNRWHAKELFERAFSITNGWTVEMLLNDRVIDKRST